MFLNLKDADKVSGTELLFGLLCGCSSDHLSAMSTLSKSKDVHKTFKHNLVLLARMRVEHIPCRTLDVG